MGISGLASGLGPYPVTDTGPLGRVRQGQEGVPGWGPGSGRGRRIKGGVGVAVEFPGKGCRVQAGSGRVFGEGVERRSRGGTRRGSRVWAGEGGVSEGGLESGQGSRVRIWFRAGVHGQAGLSGRGPGLGSGQGGVPRRGSGVWAGPQAGFRGHGRVPGAGWGWGVLGRGSRVGQGPRVGVRGQGGYPGSGPLAGAPGGVWGPWVASG